MDLHYLILHTSFSVDIINIVTSGLELFKAFFVHFRSVDDSLEQ